MSTEPRSFHLGDILTVTTGRLLSPRHVDGVYDILSYLAGGNVHTHQIGRVIDEMRPHVLACLPQLTEVSASRFTSENWETILVELEVLYGSYHELPPATERHLRIDPEKELRAMGGDENVVVVKIAKGGVS